METFSFIFVVKYATNCGCVISRVLAAVATDRKTVFFFLRGPRIKQNKMVPPSQFGTFPSGVSDSEVPPPKNGTPIIASPPSRMMSPSSCRASIGSNDRDAPFPHIPPTTQQTTRACMEKAMTVWGWTFDAFLIIVNLTDVVSDCLIARQFWVDGHKTFFWLVIVSLAIASFIYTFVGVEYLLRERMHNKLPRVIQYPVMLILSQLVPVMNWLLELLMPQANVTNGVAGWSNT
ncbi:transmembrane protein, putative, partial [Bodo saltans]